MSARILSIGTAVPDATLDQRQIRDFFARQPGVDRLGSRLIRASFDASAIERRYTVLDALALAADDADTTPGEGDAFISPDGMLLSPSTGVRNGVYIDRAPELYRRAAEGALADAGMAASEVTHVVTASCTGFFAPGPDYRLVRDLGLRPTTSRVHIGFVGCAAAFPALRAASAICAADPQAVVLVACAELCTLHIRSDADIDQIIASTVFGDGAAAAIVTAAAPDRPGLDLEEFHSTLTTQGETDMVWTIGDEGFGMTLTAEVPRIIGREIEGAVADSFGADFAADIDAWAVHPGGRSVLDRVESGLSLDAAALDASRDVLRAYGNMSSATILFILRSLLHDERLDDGATIGGLAFGPGLTVESARIVKRMPKNA